MKLQATLVVQYEANPEHYGTDNPAEMAEIDAEAFRADPATLADFYETSGSIGVTVVPDA